MFDESWRKPEEILIRIIHNAAFVDDVLSWLDFLENDTLKSNNLFSNVRDVKVHF